MDMTNEELQEFLDSELSPTASINIILGAVNGALEAGVYDELSQAVIKKAISTLKEKSEDGKNFMIKVK
jgi:hypothetical protein